MKVSKAEPAAAEAEDVKMKGGEAEEKPTPLKRKLGESADESTQTEEAAKMGEKEDKPKRKQRKSKKPKLDENGNPIPKKKRKLNHQCAAVKICHHEMKEYRDSLPEEEQEYIAKFCQLNRGAQGIMFNHMCVTMREFLKEKYPGLEKWEDMDYMEEDQKPKYTEKIKKFLVDYVEERRKESKEPVVKKEDDEKTSDDK